MRRYWKAVNRTEAHGLLWPYGLIISDEETETWARQKLVPTPSERYEINPQAMNAEFAACSYLIHRCGWNENDVRIARDRMVGSVEGNDNPVQVLDRLLDNLIPQDRADEYLDACAWLFTVIKFCLCLPAQGGIAAVAIPSDTGRFAYVGCSAQADSIEDVNGGSHHPRDVELTAASVVLG